MSFLVEPVGDAPISPRALGYVSEATRDCVYDFIVSKFIESGLTKAQLAKRLGKDPAAINRALGAPGNWTLDTCAELLFGIDGSMLTFGQEWPLRERRTNRTGAASVDMDATATSQSPNLASMQYRSPQYAKGANSALLVGA